MLSRKLDYNIVEVCFNSKKSIYHKISQSEEDKYILSHYSHYVPKV